MTNAQLPEVLDTLDKLVSGGMEYPDAEWRVSQAYRVSAERLRELYDARCMSESQRD